MDTTRLRHILAVADTLSFSRAAEQQNITQPALSRSIAAFESRYGVRLFDRGRGGVTITPAGAFVIEQARSLVRASSEFTRNVRRYAEGAAGRVSFGIGPLLAGLVLADLGSSLLARSPGLEINTVVKSPDRLVADLFEDTVEMIIGNSWQVAELHGVVVEEIASLDLAPIVRGDHPLTRQDKVLPADLAAYPVARPIRMTGGAVDAGAFICDDFHVLRDTVAATDCTWITAPAFVRKELVEGRLKVLDVEGFASMRSGIGIITLAGRTASPAARIVAQLTREALGRCLSEGG
ncbi:LysR family transcriptional regulator [Novosphingobium mangrovi (ex Huang et al. 2023)]|uniref:LysR family transcriptional regulator n=1 Tax=Novosphingobium mangrovi (ex Huang et al. 2023) TaxID=2976432 RepID=A0ABT2I329_9SPHN|nr:LysR family transcriptional regulator [Novosphingobium mangrovi (ex Huang et al. 2023)]MCT2399012.1 LysR family transcriptional regulator [Novosphingobium mangrovi (ex Huang et al. 2023)]